MNNQIKIRLNFLGEMFSSSLAIAGASPALIKGVIGIVDALSHTESAELMLVYRDMLFIGASVSILTVAILNIIDNYKKL